MGSGIAKACIAAGLVAAYLGALGAACPPAAPAADAHMHHAHHEAAASHAGHHAGHDPGTELRAPCGCGCGDAPVAPSRVARTPWGLQTETPEPLPAFLNSVLGVAPAPAPASPVLGLDPIPI